MSIPKRIALVVGFTLLTLLAISELDWVDAVELDEEDFVPLATQGFMTAVDGTHPEGSRRNNYMWSMRWWQGKLYVGTLRDAFCLFGLAGGGGPPGYEPGGPICPPTGTLTPNQRAEIWAYTPGGEGGIQGTWQRVFQSPLLLGDLTQFPRDLGYRTMIDCDVGGNQHLYVANFGLGGRILYTPDGSTFLEASVLGLNLFGDLGYRAMACWKGRLWISPSGTFSANPASPELPFSIDPDAALLPVLLTNDDPSSPDSPWQMVLNVASDALLGDAGNVGIFSMAVFGDALYLGVTNRTTGFEIWRADGAGCDVPPGPCALTWQKLIEDGGGRPVPPGETADNARIFDFDEFDGDLYWTTGETGFAKFVLAEMGRVGPDGRWDLIVGEPREASAMAADPNFNCQLDDSSCIPLSGMGPGFGPTPFTGGGANYIWQLEPHDGVFYAGTLERSDVSTEEVPGFDLWRSSNGTDWSLVSDDGFGNPFNSGVRTMASTPLGLFVGTQNPNTIEDGTRGGTGGGEVWLGIGDPE